MMKPRMRLQHLVMVLLLSGVIYPAAAEDGWEAVSFEALPCGSLCATGLHQSFTSDVCGEPLPSGTYDEVWVTAPQGTNYLFFEGFPELDWDLFVCDSEGQLVAYSANDPKDGCENPGISVVPVGCIERVGTGVTAGRQYMLRGFNFADVHPMPGRYRLAYLPPPDLGPPPPSTDPPTLGRRTLVSAIGDAGMSVFIPDDVRLEAKDLGLELVGGTYAIAVLAPLSCGAPAKQCISAVVFSIARWGPRPLTPIVGPALVAGPHEVYLVTDGRATLSIDIAELTGGVELDAQGSIEAEVVDIPRTCEPHTDCAFGYGGVTRSLGSDGFVGAFAFARRPKDTLLQFPGFVSSAQCRDYDDVEPDHHPHGCEAYPSTTLESLINTRETLQEVAGMNSGSAEYGVSAVSAEAAWVGFSAGAWSLGSQVDYGGYGVWIRKSMPTA